MTSLEEHLLKFGDPSLEKETNNKRNLDDVTEPSAKRRKLNKNFRNDTQKPYKNNNKQKNTKGRNKIGKGDPFRDDYYFNVSYKSPKQMNFDESYCVVMRGLLPNITEGKLYYLIKNTLSYNNTNENIESDEKNNNSNLFDIHLFHNRHQRNVTGYVANGQ